VHYVAGETVERRGLAALAQDAAELRAAYRELPEQLAAVYTFESLFAGLIERWRPLMVQMNHRWWDPDDERIAGEVAAVDDLRLDLYSRQSTTLPSYRDPLNKMLYTSLRDPGPSIYELFGCKVADDEDSVPHDAVSVARFDAKVAEAKADIVRHRLEVVAQLRRDGARLHELEDAVPRLVLATVRSLLWKNARRRAVTIAGAVLVAWLTPAVRGAVTALWTWIRSRF